MKNTYYFPHDYHARHDPKLDKLFLTYGYEGVGVYWCLVEMLYEQDGYLNIVDMKLLSRGDDELCGRIINVIRDFGLFKFDDDRFWSESLLKRLKLISDKSKKATKSALNRWYGYTDALPTDSDSNAIKESKVKETTTDRESIRKVINFLIDCKGWDRGNSALITDVYKRSGKAAKSLIAIAGDADKACKAIETMSLEYTKKGLSWTLETVIKHYPELTKEVEKYEGAWGR